MMLKKEEFMVSAKCDAHPWEQCYFAVLRHPFFAVTGKDGNYEIEGLAPGIYEVEAWHEKMGSRIAKVTILAGEEKRKVDFVFAR